MARARQKFWWRALGALCLAIGAVAWCAALWIQNRSLAPAARKPATADATRGASIDAADFVGSDACATCHSRIWQAYQQHPMGRSLAAAVSAPAVEDFDVAEFTPPGPRRYAVERTSDGVRHHEILTDDDGSVLYDQGVDVAYALGSGRRGRAYLIEHDGMLFKSPIAWFSRPRAWGLSPGYPPEQHKRFERRITEGCINCHAGRMAEDRAAPDTYMPPVVVEAAIGCERCHGPGRRHIEAHDAARSPANELIVNPARLDAARRDSICAQCHLHGKATVVRSGQKICDFRPGQLLEDNRVVFVAPPESPGETGASALSQVEQMLASACYIKSGGRLGCTSCHDPHALPSTESRIEFYRSKCLACHETRGCGLPSEERLARDGADSCIACHMPARLTVGNILHVALADHRVLRQPPGEPAGDEPPAFGAAAIAVFDHADRRLPKLEVDRATAFMLVGGLDRRSATPAEARRAEKLLLPVRKAQPDDIDVLEILGAAALIQSRAAEAEEWWRDALRLDPRRESVLEHLAILCHDQKRMVPAREFLGRYLAVNRWHAAMYGRYAGALESLGQRREAIAAAEHGLELNPSLAPLHEWLAEAYAEIGETEKSDRHRELFDRLERRLRPPE